MDPGQKAETTMTTHTATALLAAVTTVTVRLDADAFEACIPERYAAELTKVFPGAEVEVKRAGLESEIDATGEIDGEALRIIEGRGRVDILTGADFSGRADEDIRHSLALAWERQFGG